METNGYASLQGSFFEPFKYRLPDLRPTDLLVEVLYCGLCHTDLFLAGEEWGASLTLRPLVPGHEAIGRVTKKGSLCRRFDVSDLVGIGFISEACGTCSTCLARHPAACEGQGFISTFSAINIYRQDKCLGTGGFGRHLVIHETYAIKLPPKLVQNAQVLPFYCSLLCSGLAVWAALRQILGAPPDVASPKCGGRRLNIAVVGLGTAGHIAAQLVSALGHRLICLSFNPRKEHAIKKLCPGAEFVLLSDETAMARYKQRVHVVVDCCPGLKRLHSLLCCLKAGGTFVALAIPPDDHVYGLDAQLIARKRITVTGAFMGSLTDAENLLEWVSTAAPHVHSRASLLPISQVNEAAELMTKNGLFNGEQFAVVFDLA